MPNPWWTTVLEDLHELQNALKGLVSTGISAGEKKAVKSMKEKLNRFEEYAKSVIELEKAKEK